MMERSFGASNTRPFYVDPNSGQCDCGPPSDGLCEDTMSADAYAETPAHGVSLHGTWPIPDSQ